MSRVSLPDSVPAQPGAQRPGIASVVRFATELVAWVATPWALWSVSPVLAIVAVVLLIGLPTVFATPGDKPQVIVAVPGFVTILLVVMQLVAAALFAPIAWPLPAVIVVWVLCAACVVTEAPRWSGLARRSRSTAD